MKRFLTVTRRVFLGGTLSLIIIFILYAIGNNGWQFNYSDTVGRLYLAFAVVSPILGVVFWLISSAYIRKRGQAADYQQTLKFSTTMFKMLKSDLSSPFRLIAAQFVSKKKLAAQYGEVLGSDIGKALAEGSQAINHQRLLFTILRFAFYVVGTMSAVSVLKTVV